MSLGFLLALGLVGLWMVWQGRRRAAYLVAHPDETTLAALRRAGSDLTRPHEVEFYLYLPTESAADTVASTLRMDGFATLLSPDEGGREWLCLATRGMIPELGALQQLRTRLGTLAQGAGGEYDGWGATVVETGATIPSPG